jgi:3-hydroxybutyrate dehydrogenase
MRKALVTGGGSGIGEAVVCALAEDGTHVIVADRDSDAAGRVAKSVGGEAWVIDLLATDALLDLTLDVDILVNNAGFQTVSPIDEFDPLVFRRMLTVMLEAPFLLARVGAPRNVRARLRSNRQRFVGARSPGIRIQERLRVREARA